MEIFQNRKIIIATKHQKESVIAPVFEKELGVCCFTDSTFDTDLFGTFSGEIERKLDPLATARAKCLGAMKQAKCDLGIASEGSFGSHPTLHFIPANEEFMVFIDTKNKLEITSREIRTQTNFAGKQVTNTKDLMDFALASGFPLHGLILRKAVNDYSAIKKGITDSEFLKMAFEEIADNTMGAYVETDMRAMYNPTRMGVIQQTAQNLVQKIKSICPACQFPGFAISSAQKGLLCKSCGLPTNSILQYNYVCKMCDYCKVEVYPHDKTAEDLMYCNYCNP